MHLFCNMNGGCIECFQHNTYMWNDWGSGGQGDRKCILNVLLHIQTLLFL